eukprot:2696126-Pleurochrysis_carterae.AAC.1
MSRCSGVHMRHVLASRSLACAGVAIASLTEQLCLLCMRVLARTKRRPQQAAGTQRTWYTGCWRTACHRRKMCLGLLRESCTGASVLV